VTDAEKEFLAIGLGAVVAGATELIRSGSKEEALTKAIEELENARAKEKFPNLRVKT